MPFFKKPAGWTDQEAEDYVDNQNAIARRERRSKNIHAAAAYYAAHPSQHRELMRRIENGTFDPLNLPGLGNIDHQ